MVKKFGMFVLGGIVGAAAVFFSSPRSGYENRNLAKNALHATLDSEGNPMHGSAVENIQAVAQNVASKGQEIAAAAAEKGQEFYVTASAKASEMVNNARVDTSEEDELRDKIEAARQRIAAQVIKNAEETQAAASIDVSVEVAAEAAEAEEEQPKFV